jgi:peptidoglycan/xylan/chitin deacetylase (PgdA/CDA1 family)
MKTPNVLRELKQAKVHGTFFMSPASGGEPTAGQCQLVEKVLSEGHSVQAHSWDHLDFKNLTNEQVVADLRRTREWIEACAGNQRDRLNLNQFRPPYGSLDVGQAEFISNLGYTIAGWTIESKDILGRPRRDVFQKIIGDFRRTIPDGGSASILMHDKHYDESGTQGIIQMLVPYFQNLGYKFVTADDCYNNCNEYVSVCEVKTIWPRWATL